MWITCGRTVSIVGSYAQNIGFAAPFLIEMIRRYFHHDRCTRKRRGREFLKPDFIDPSGFYGLRRGGTAPRQGKGFIPFPGQGKADGKVLADCCKGLPDARRSLVDCEAGLFWERLLSLVGVDRFRGAKGHLAGFCRRWREARVHRSELCFGRGRLKVRTQERPFAFDGSWKGGIGNGHSWNRATSTTPKG